MSKKAAVSIIIVLICLCVIVLGILCGFSIKHIVELFYKNTIEEKIITEEKEVPLQLQENTEMPQKESESKTVDISYVSDNLAALGGKYQWGVHFYNTDFSYMSQSFKAPSASIIKVFIMEYAFSRIEKGEISLNYDWGNGSVENLINSMITVSDNHSTNILIEYFTMEKLNAFFAESGYGDTKLERKMLDYNAMAEGKDNYTSLNDVMRFLDKIYINRNEAPYSDMLEIMKKQQRRNKIPSMLPTGVTVANKTGEIQNVENDIGIVFSDKGDFAIVFLLSSQPNAGNAQTAIGESVLNIYQNAI